MLIIREHANAFLVVTKEYNVKGGKMDKHLPPGIIRLNPTVTELKVDKFPALCEHPDFIEAVERGEFKFITEDEVLDNFPRTMGAKSRAAAFVPAPKGKKKGAKAEPAPKPKPTTQGPDMVAIGRWPQHLKDLKDLLAYAARPATVIAANVVDVDTLKRWLEAEKGVDRERTSVIEYIDKQIAKVTGIDNSRRSRARA